MLNKENIFARETKWMNNLGNRAAKKTTFPRCARVFEGEMPIVCNEQYAGINCDSKHV